MENVLQLPINPSPARSVATRNVQATKIFAIVGVIVKRQNEISYFFN
jgi:hypothetical protein